MEDSCQPAITDNAARLLKDAEILAAAGSCRTAMSLAVLSLEESGKACLIHWKALGHIKRDISREVRSGHIDKHVIFGAYRTAKAISLVGKIVKKEPGSPIREMQERDPEFIKQLDEALTKNANVPSHVAELGILDHFKQEGFYTDFDDSLNAVAPSIEYNTQWFDFVAEYAREALEMARAAAATHEIVAVLYGISRQRMLPAKERRAAMKKVIEHARKMVGPDAKPSENVPRE